MKKRLYQIAKEMNFSNQECLRMAQELGFSATTSSSGLDEYEERKLLESLRVNQHSTMKKSKSFVETSSSQVKSAKNARKQPKAFSEKYEKKSKKKERVPEVKTISRQRANVLFLFILMFVTAVLVGLGGIGIATDFRMNQLVKDTTQAIQILNKENQNQTKVIEQLQKQIKESE